MLDFPLFLENTAYDISKTWVFISVLKRSFFYGFFIDIKYVPQVRGFCNDDLGYL